MQVGILVCYLLFDRGSLKETQFIEAFYFMTCKQLKSSLMFVVIRVDCFGSAVAPCVKLSICHFS